MVLRLEILGYEFLRVTLDMEQPEHVTNPVERGIKVISKAWVKRMVAG